MRGQVLRLELLSLYGGIWVDVTSCPIKPLDDFVLKLLGTTGFFAWHGPYARMSGFGRAATCARNPTLADFFADGNATLNIDNWFLVSPLPHHLLVDAWLYAVTSAIAALPPGAKPWTAKVELRYVYHFVQCVFNQLYTDNSTVRAVYDGTTQMGYCQQGGVKTSNAVEWCEFEASRVHPDVKVGPRGSLGYPSEQMDHEPDPKKTMYKGAKALSNMKFDAYERWVASQTQPGPGSVPYVGSTHPHPHAAPAHQWTSKR